MIDADVIKLKELLEDQLTIVHTTGCTETKYGFLTTIESKKLTFFLVSSKDLIIRIYINTPIITGLADVKLIARGDSMVFMLRFLKVSRKICSSWQLFAWQSVKTVVGS